MLSKSLHVYASKHAHTRAKKMGVCCSVPFKMCTPKRIHFPWEGKHTRMVVKALFVWLVVSFFVVYPVGTVVEALFLCPLQAQEGSLTSGNCRVWYFDVDISFDPMQALIGIGALTALFFVYVLYSVTCICMYNRRWLHRLPPNVASSVTGYKGPAHSGTGGSLMNQFVVLGAGGGSGIPIDGSGNTIDIEMGDFDEGVVSSSHFVIDDGDEGTGDIEGVGQRWVIDEEKPPFSTISHHGSVPTSANSHLTSKHLAQQDFLSATRTTSLPSPPSFSGSTKAVVPTALDYEAKRD